MGDDCWGPWIEHDGKGCPVPLNCWVDTIDAFGEQEQGVAAEFCEQEDFSCCWTYEGLGFFGVEIIRYRIRKPAALQTLIGIAAHPAPLP